MPPARFNLKPNDVTAWQLLATTNVKLAKWQEAKNAFERVLAFRAGRRRGVVGTWAMRTGTEELSAAVDRLQSVLRLDPTRLLAHFYLSRAYAAMGRTEDAEHEAALHQLMMEQMTFVRSVESDERESPIKAQARQLLAEHREADALQLYREHFKGTAATPADAYVFVGKLYLFMGRHGGWTAQSSSCAGNSANRSRSPYLSGNSGAETGRPERG